MGGGFKNHEQPLSESWDPCLPEPVPVPCHRPSVGQRASSRPCSRKKAPTSTCLARAESETQTQGPVLRHAEQQIEIWRQEATNRHLNLVERLTKPSHNPVGLLLSGGLRFCCGLTQGHRPGNQRVSHTEPAPFISAWGFVVGWVWGYVPATTRHCCTVGPKEHLQPFPSLGFFDSTVRAKVHVSLPTLCSVHVERSGRHATLSAV